MSLHFFTSINADYMPKAQILVRTLKEHNPDAFFVLVFSDDLPEGFDLSQEPFDAILYGEKLSRIGNPDQYFFKYNVTEACTAVKPAAALEIMDRFGAEKVCYLDPDIAVFSDFSELEQLLDEKSMVFTPHTTVPEESDQWIIGNEVLFLKRGCNNLGFFAVKNDDEGRRFLEWWHSRVSRLCADDNMALLPLLEQTGFLGMFTDQKWIDLVPSFFDNYCIFKHPGYNVSTWNLTHRSVEKTADGYYTINGKPLVFFHFSGVDSGAHRAVLEQVIDAYPAAKWARELSDWYLMTMKEQESAMPEKHEWKYSRYSNGELIDPRHRKIFLICRDVHSLFKTPFQVTDGLCFYTWVTREYSQLLQKQAAVYQPPVPRAENWFWRWVKRFVKRFVTPDSPLYFKLKRLWHKMRR